MGGGHDKIGPSSFNGFIEKGPIYQAMQAEKKLYSEARYNEPPHLYVTGYVYIACRAIVRAIALNKNALRQAVATQREESRLMSFCERQMKQKKRQPFAAFFAFLGRLVCRSQFSRLLSCNADLARPATFRDGYRNVQNAMFVLCADMIDIQRLVEGNGPLELTVADLMKQPVYFALVLQGRIVAFQRQCLLLNAQGHILWPDTWQEGLYLVALLCLRDVQWYSEPSGTIKPG
jgi:hypothetical protein